MRYFAGNGSVNFSARLWTGQGWEQGYSGGELAEGPQGVGLPWPELFASVAMPLEWKRSSLRLSSSRDRLSHLKTKWDTHYESERRTTYLIDWPSRVKLLTSIHHLENRAHAFFSGFRRLRRLEPIDDGIDVCFV